MIQFTVPGVPISQPRVKATRRGNHTGVYTPTTTGKGDKKKSNGIAEFKALVKLVASQHYDGPPLTGPLQVDLLFVFPRQAAKVWKSRPMPRYRHVTRPDRDNLEKALTDSLTKMIWVDDTQICAGSIEKWHASGDEAPHTLVTVIELVPTLTN